MKRRTESLKMSIGENNYIKNKINQKPNTMKT